MITIRTYEESDREAVWALHNAGLHQFASHGGNGSWDEDLHLIEEVYLRNGGEFLVGIVDGEPVAMGTLRRKTEDTAEIKRMRVRLDMQQRGFGSLILRKLEERAVELGYSKLILDTTVQQMPAQKLYLKHGFREVRRMQIAGFHCILFEKEIRSEVTRLLLIRHCRAEGQPPEAPLTAEGFQQAQRLAERLAPYPIDRIVSSPYLRARQTAAPLAQVASLPVETDARLAERVLCTGPAPHYMELLRQSFEQPDLRFEGGESSRMAMARAEACIADLRRSGLRCIAAVTHGNLMTLMLKLWDERFGYDAWAGLTNPDVYRILLSADRAPHIKRIWEPQGTGD